MVEPTAILNVYPITKPTIDESEPNIADKASMVFKLFEYKYAVAAGVISNATIITVPTLCIAVIETNAKRNINK